MRSCAPLGRPAGERHHHRGPHAPSWTFPCRLSPLGEAKCLPQPSWVHLRERDKDISPGPGTALSPLSLPPGLPSDPASHVNTSCAAQT